MIKAFENIKNKYITYLQIAIIATAGIGIAISPFVVDYGNLPKGYELPKVFFSVIFCSIIIILSFIKYSLQLNSNKITIPRSFYIMLLISVILTLSTLLSPFIDIAVWGNPFRYQGLLTYLLLLWAGYGVYSNINKFYWHFISLAFVFSTLVQTAVAFNQFSDLLRLNPDYVLEGIWVNGNFGQTNWFAGRVLMALIICAYYLGLRIKSNTTIRLIFKLYFSLLLIFFLVIIGLSQSEWGIISAIFAIILIVLYEILPKKVFSIGLVLLIILGVIGSLIFLRINTAYNLRIEILNSIVAILTQPLNFHQVKILLLGFGFDTLGEVFKEYGLIKGLLVDRAHNFILDIIIQNGLLILLAFTTSMIYIFKKVYGLNKDRIIDYTFLLIIAWMFRSVIHENGIVNIVDYIFLLFILLSLLKNSSHRFNSINTKKS